MGETGHVVREPSILEARVQAAEAFAERGQKAVVKGLRMPPVPETIPENLSRGGNHMRGLLAFRPLGLVLLLTTFWLFGPREGTAQVLEVVDREPAFIAVGGGAFDALDDDTAGQFNFEYRSNRRLWIFKPQGGLMVSTDGAVYGYAGFRIDLFFGRRWVVSPSTAIGVFEEGSGKDLGSALEFRSGIELGYRFDDRSRLSAGLFHLSNASVGNTNPGEESIVVFYAIPVERLARHW